MPEYLAPGVYMEEIEIGARPMEGVSTSTAGFLGYAERGPLDKPTLVTSFAEFERIFGGFLSPKKNGKDLQKIRWLAYAVSGFFENGGKRAFITRVADATKATSSGFLPTLADEGTPPFSAEEVQAQATWLKLSVSVPIPAAWSEGDVLLLKDEIQSEYLEFKGAAKIISLNAAATLALPHPAGTKIWKGTRPPDATATISSDVTAGDREMTLSEVLDIQENDYLLIQDTTNEVVVVQEVTDNTVTTTEPLRFDHATDTEVFKLTTSKETTLLYATDEEASELYVDKDSTLANDDYIIVGSEYHQIKTAVDATDVFQFSPPLKYAHEAGKDLIALVPAVAVTASSEGTWGNSVKVAVRPASLCVTELTSPVPTSPDRLNLETVTGIEPGSLLKLPNTVTPRYVTVREVHKTETETFVILENEVSGTFNIGDPVHTEEFDLIVTDGKNEETFKNLSLNEEHSRYIKKIVTEKSSSLIRIGDLTGTPPVILMPTPDDLPGWRLTGGHDGFPGNPNSDADLNPIYEGEDANEPDDRTGLYTFKNVDEINIIAIPGVTSKYLQQKLITHCEISMKDRFAVLDAQPQANLDEIRAQRNLFDTSYAALYYPWVYSFDPLTKEYINKPPSGYVCGVYARTDVERGVHKAPANEKINGVVGTERLNGSFRVVNKGTQEILNPLGINCIRAFPGRGIRIWGARTISSNSLWKYLNVRRLFLFLEESIEKGTQWVVFEPNDEKLWARVKQTVTQFLTRVWKDGALMGSTPDEAFFVKCDRTTMTQDDIDNGRLIILIGVAPVKPAEFVIFRVAQWQGGSAVTE